MLKQGTESPSKKRFNPHPTEEPPQLKEPKRITKKVKWQNKFKYILSISQKKKDVKEEIDFAQFDIEQLLADEGIDFRNPEKAPGGWIPFEAYDEDFDMKTPSGWLKKKLTIKT